MFDTLISILLGLLIIGSVFVIIADDGDPGRKLAWILIITVLPAAGLVLYFLVGINYRHHWIFNRRHQRYLNLFNSSADEKLNDLLFGHEADSRIKEEYRQLARLMGQGVRPAACDGNSFEIITDGHRKYELLMEDIRHARQSIHIEYFHFGADSGSKAIKELLNEKAREGVKVRFINENIANFPISSRYYDSMKKAGVEVVKFTNPRQHLLDWATRLNYRNHRKIVVIDGRIGYTGGMNINNHYFLQWRDTHLRITGRAVASLQYIFLDSWLTANGSLDQAMLSYYPMLQEDTEISPPPSPDSFQGKLVQIVPDEPDSLFPIIQMSYEWTIQHAKRYVYMQTPYLVPPEPVLNALKSAALSGVDVRIMLPRKADQFFMGLANRSYFLECLEAGVRIFERKGEFMHCKTFVSDDYLSSIGSANMDNRSFTINYEVNTYIYDEETALRNKEIFFRDMELCEEVTLERAASLPWYTRFLQRLISLFAPLL